MAETKRFSSYAQSGQAIIEYICVGVFIYHFGEIIRKSDSMGMTETGKVVDKHIESNRFNRFYYVTVKNGEHKADHEVSLAEYNAAKKGDSFPIVLDGKSDDIEADEQKEESDNAAAEAASEAYGDGWSAGRIHGMAMSQLLK